MAEFIIDVDGWMRSFTGRRIVRCRDCEHFAPNEEFWVGPTLIGTSDTCDFWAGTKCKVTPDGFCAWGERREDG